MLPLGRSAKMYSILVAAFPAATIAAFKFDSVPDASSVE
jgi:hypothetical protein